MRQHDRRVRYCIVGILTALLLALGAGCMTMKTVDYTPKPEQSERPAEDFIRLVMMAKKWKPSEVAVKKTFATLWYYGSNVPGGEVSVTIPYDEVDSIEVGQVRGHDVVRVLDEDGEKLYEYVAHDMEKAKEFADAMAALAAADGDIEPEATSPQGE
jgi:hypothetical protein